ncbi:hypothetical protein COLO4_28356 [Corchorus olitorius]|uniref:Uncharacterized protein n=1 Tax=Corchorus olitorius TaxID=93759 RepID=A0A1R3HLM9_9ROSI|nr:hypothetical protein COLO4_28356 [Corchorus olitorius]
MYASFDALCLLLSFLCLCLVVVQWCVGWCIVCVGWYGRGLLMWTLNPKGSQSEGVNSAVEVPSPFNS